MRVTAGAISRACLVGCVCIAFAGTLVWKAPILLLWNASPSVPIGLYRVESRVAFARGDMVIALTPEPFRSLGDRRRYIPASVPLVKRVAASTDDRVCAKGQFITVNGRTTAVRIKADSQGRSLPWWQGCRFLAQGEVLLLGDAPRSFDGRYFGPTRRQDVLGKAVRL